MHVAASAPVCVDETGVPEDTLERERSILIEQAKGSGKPADIIEKMVQGRLNQPFVKDPDISVGKLLKQHDATVAGFVRYEVGEGIEKKEDNFAEEVMAQVAAATGKS